jgi:hypothetical protein
MPRRDPLGDAGVEQLRPDVGGYVDDVIRLLCGSVLRVLCSPSYPIATSHKRPPEGGHYRNM